MTLTIGYARTSTDDQDLARQINALLNEGIPHHLVFSDQGVSGVRDPDRRTGYRQVLSLIDTGEVSRLVITDLSRVGRDAKGTLREIWNLMDRGIEIVSLNPSDKFVLEASPEYQPLLMAAVTLGADIQRRKTIEDTKAGLVRARQEGRIPGRPPAVIDWDKIDEWIKKGLSERSAAIVCGYKLSTFYKKKRLQKGKGPIMMPPEPVNQQKNTDHQQRNPEE